VRPVSRFVVAEVVTNSYDHAFPGGKGSITVSVQSVPDVNTMTMTPSDDGEGFKAQAESKRPGLAWCAATLNRSEELQASTRKMARCGRSRSRFPLQLCRVQSCLTPLARVKKRPEALPATSDIGTFRTSQADAAMSAPGGRADKGRALFDFW
jgi:hypothetical protein